MLWIKSIRRITDGCTDCEFYRISYANGKSKELTVTGRPQVFQRLMRYLANIYKS
jgi:hypothetical protein